MRAPPGCENVNRSAARSTPTLRFFSEFLFLLFLVSVIYVRARARPIFCRRRRHLLLRRRRGGGGGGGREWGFVY